MDLLLNHALELAGAIAPAILVPYINAWLAEHKLGQFQNRVDALLGILVNGAVRRVTGSAYTHDTRFNLDPAQENAVVEEVRARLQEEAPDTYKKIETTLREKVFRRL